MRIKDVTLGVLLVTVGCGKVSGPTGSTREGAAKALQEQMPPLTFTTRGKDKEILVLHYPKVSFEPCEKIALEALIRMEPDPLRTRDSTAPVGDLEDMFKHEVTPEDKARMETIRKLVSQFRRVECETKTGSIIAVPVSTSNVTR